MRSGRPGVRMYCVLLPDDGVQAVLVDAGWWPLDGKRDLPIFGCPLGRGVAVRGLLAPPPSSGLAHGDALAASGPQRWLATRLDLQAIARELKLSTGIAPRVLRLDPARCQRIGAPVDRGQGFAAIGLAGLVNAALAVERAQGPTRGGLGEGRPGQRRAEQEARGESEARPGRLPHHLRSVPRAAVDALACPPSRALPSRHA